MWDYYEGKSLFVTGGSGFLGTAIVHRLLTSTSTLRIYLLCRGGIDKLRARWMEWLPASSVESFCSSNRLIVFDGDILLPDLGLSEEILDIIRDNASTIIHAASSINLRSPLSKLFGSIVDASDKMVDLALTCKRLECFVYVSTAYVNTHLYPKSDEPDLKIDEEIYELSTPSNVLDEVNEVRKRGTSRAYEAENFPWAYAYAKHLTERLVHHRFMEHTWNSKLLIVRPSIIGPAQCLPFPGYMMPMSSPSTMLAAALALSPSRKVKIATMKDNSHWTSDEVPVDVVVDRMLCHLAMGTSGCIHAVSGIKSRIVFDEWRESLMKLRRIPWGLHPHPIKGDWKSRNQHPIIRFYAILATSFDFSEDRTTGMLQNIASKEPLDLQKEVSDLQLFTKIDMSTSLPSRVEGIRYVMDQFSRKSEAAKLILLFLYSDF
ncbi:hypothetical protein N7457_008920, partial [Penicillium paradoxum]|uniref:uncharacterized protein n=1 Tax=Penicillium paradoxum TaxID=176176 RepID=UPI0025468ECB